MHPLPRYISPLNIYVIWHPAFGLGQEVADYLYASFTRDTAAPLSRGLGIPVFFRSEPQTGSSIPRAIPIEEADFNALVVLIDDVFFNDDAWNRFVKSLIGQIDAKTRIFPVSFSDNAYYFEEATLGREQFIDGRSANISGSINASKVLTTIRSRLLHGLSRLMLGQAPEDVTVLAGAAPPPIRLFISHAKKDGEVEAAAFRDYVRTNTKLNTFFDANDIADGYRFDDQLREAAAQSALVVFHSDLYATREWCQIEVLTAKRFKAPIVVVHHITMGERRSFPYMGNVPTIRFQDNNFGDIIDLTLYQVLNNIFQKMHLASVKALFLKDDVPVLELSSPPELFNFIDILSHKEHENIDKLLVLYPDPPLGTQEMQVLNEMGKQLVFATPLLLSTY